MVIIGNTMYREGVKRGSERMDTDRREAFLHFSSRRGNVACLERLSARLKTGVQAVSIKRPRSVSVKNAYMVL